MRGCGHTFVRLGLVVTSLAMGPGVAKAAPIRCDLPVTVTPPNLPAGARTARIHIPAGLADVQIRASSGTAGSPVSFGAGTVEAEFQASADSPPIVVVAAVGANACGFSVIRVAAPREAPSSASPVSVALVEPSAASADQDADVNVYVFATDERGNPRRGGAPTIQPSVGTVARVESIGPGAWRARWRVPSGDATAAAVTAAFGLEPSVATSLARKPGTPQSIEITQDPAVVGAAGSRTSVLIRVRDSAGNLTDETPVLESDVAQFDAPVRLERGVYQVPVVIPPETRDTAILVTARADRAVSTATLAVTPSAAAQVRVTPHEPIVADGSAQGRFEVIEVEVVDAFGKPVDDVPVGSGGRGEFRPALPVSPGHWALPYRPPRVSEDTTEQVVITAGPATAKVELALQARRLSVSLGLKGGVGFVGGGVGPAAGAEVALWRSFGRTQLGLVLDVDWWMVSRTSTAVVAGAASTFDSTQSYVPFLLALGWRAPFADRWMVWATAGGGGAFVSSRSQLAGQPSVSESGFAPAASGSLSVGPRLGPGWLFLEARATWIGDPGLSTLSGSTFTFLGLLGYRFDVG